VLRRNASWDAEASVVLELGVTRPSVQIRVHWRGSPECVSLLTARRRTAVWRRFRAAALVSLARTRSFLVCAIRSARSANRRGSIFPSKRPPSLRANRVKHCIYHGTFEGIPRSPAFLGVDTGSFYITLGRAPQLISRRWSIGIRGIRLPAQNHHGPAREAPDPLTQELDSPGFRKHENCGIAPAACSVGRDCLNCHSAGEVNLSR